MPISNRQLYYQHLASPAFVPEAPEFSSAEGIYLYDNDNNPWVDLVSGVAVSNVGHRHPRVVEAIKNQVDKYMHLMVYGEFIQAPQVQLAGLLAQNLPATLNSVYFVNSGSEANEGALKLAKRVTGRSEIIAFENAYHGGTQGALSILGNEAMKYAFRPLLPDIRFLKFNEWGDLQKITSKTAAVVVESVQAEAGIVLPQNGWLPALRERCNETGTLLILDDIQMGFGRTGKLFSFEHFDFVPDILTLAKGMGGGMPIGAFIASKELMNQLQFQPALGHITTFGGHPVSCAAAKASLEVLLNEHLVEQVEEKGMRFEEALKNIPVIKEIRRIGLMLGIDLKDSTLCQSALQSMFKHRLIADYFLFNPTSFRIAPPLIITREQIDQIIHTLTISLNKIIEK